MSRLANLKLVRGVSIALAIALAETSPLALTGAAHTRFGAGLPALPHITTKPLGQPINGPRHVAIHPAEPDDDSIDPVDLRVLVISADASETDLPAIRQILDYMGTPYDLYVGKQTPGGLTSAALSSGAHGFYQGVILTTGSLAYFDGTTYVSALTQTEWQALWAYEATFGIRQVTWYTYPTADYGFQTPTAVDTTPPNPPVLATLTTAGTSVFGTVNAANPLAISYAYTYMAQPVPDGLTVPLLTDSQGNALAAVRTYPDQNNRTNLALTFDSNQYLVHDLVLAYGVVNWVTGGLFLGERHAWLAAQVDDVFIDNDIWWPGLPCGSSVENTGVTYRLTGNDMQSVLSWQAGRQADPLTQSFRLDLAFNGIGTTTAWNDDYGSSPDSLTPLLTQNQNLFKWISHTYDHAELDGFSYASALQEFQGNIDVATQLGLTNWNRANIVTPSVSGLTTAAVMHAAYDAGIRYTVTDTSRPGYDNPSPNAGILNPLEPRILMAPRHPTNLYFNVSTPDEWAAEYNCNYHDFWGRDLTYQEILDYESQRMLLYLLNGDIDPLMFHQPNLRNFPGAAGAQSLLGDLLDTTIAKYESLSNLPILSPTEDDIGLRMGQRMAYNDSGVTASRAPGPPASITLTAQRAATIPVTGLCITGAESYGGQCIAHISLAAGQSITIPIP
jgi:hypothetical protein